MMKEGLIEQLKSIRHFFLNSTKCLSEEDSNFKPQEKIYSVAQVIGHTADTVDWFFDGAFSEKGFDMNFDNYEERSKLVKCQVKSSFEVDLRIFQVEPSIVYSTKIKSHPDSIPYLSQNSRLQPEFI